MPRKRINKEDNWLPSRVYRGRSSYEWRPKGGRCIPLCPLTKENGKIIEPPEVKRQVLDAYDQAEKEQSQPKNVDYWLTRFLASPRFAQLGHFSQRDYTRYIEILAKPDDKKSRNGIRFVFGKMQPTTVKTHHIRKYMDYWATSGKEVTANRHLSCLQAFFGWLREQNANIELNPATGIKKFKEESRAVYIEDDAYDKLLKAAFVSSRPYLAPAMEIAYLCGLRRHEVIKLDMEDITDKGLFIRRGKGSKNEITEISERLQKAIDYAISLHNPSKPEPLKNRPLVRNNSGGRLTGSALYQAWRMVREQAGLPDFWVHDLKKKAGTDDKDLGHMTPAMKAMYNLKPAVKKATR